MDRENQKVQRAWQYLCTSNVHYRDNIKIKFSYIKYKYIVDVDESFFLKHMYCKVGLQKEVYTVQKMKFIYGWTQKYMRFGKIKTTKMRYSEFDINWILIYRSRIWILQCNICLVHYEFILQRCDNSKHSQKTCCFMM